MKPWMDNREIQKIVSYLKPNYKMFEWGCGGSTIYFSKFVSLYRSVEHKREWYNKIKQSVGKNTEIFLYENTDDYQSYITSISKYKDQYDAILVDGRQRVLCSIIAKSFLKTNGLLFVHDYFNRPYYHCIENYFYLVDYVNNTQQTLAIFKHEIYN